jgi:pimeloyl-ACP methyl ester carboxylesterase
MVRVFKSVSTLCVTILAVAILMAGCGSKSSSQQAGTVNIDPLALFTSIKNGSQQSIAHSLGGWDWSSFVSNFGTLLINIKYTLDMQKVTYQSTGADGKIHSMTGLLILPRSISGSKPSVPILMYQHGTEVYRPFSPSRYLTHLDSPTNYPEVMVAALIASTGYAVALVDYEGMGDNTDPQPHVVGARLAQQVIDLLIASRGIIGGSNSPCSWNNQLFLMGYSEGGYVTMIVTRELQLNPVSPFTVTASAPLSGPYDLSGVMRKVILGEILTEPDGTFKAPYFVPMLLTSYNYAYGINGVHTSLFSSEFAMLPKYNNSIPPLFALFDGNSQSDTISEAMGMTFSSVNPILIVPKSTLTQAFIDDLTSNTSAGSAFAFLQENDSYLYPGNVNLVWVPTVPMRMIHDVNDDLVPYANSQVAFSTFSTAGAKNHILGGHGVELVANAVVINNPSDPVKTVHFGAAFPELIDGWRWINGFKH